MHKLLIILTCLGSVPALAEEPVAPPQAVTPAEPASDVGVGSTGELSQGWLTTAVNGFLDTRFSYTQVDWRAPVPARDVPRYANLTEANVQLKFRWKNPQSGEEVGEALADASFLYQHAGVYLDQDAAGNRAVIADHDVAALHPAAILSEIYGTWHLGEHAQLTLGKKRVVWGPGLTINPTDLLNPPKDPSDPALQRAGAWLARWEMPFEKWTLSLVGAAKTTVQYGGVPAGLVYYPDATKGQGLWDASPHFALAARVYALVAETDVNAMVYMTQRYNDQFEYKPRFGLTASHVFANSVEVHVEALGQTGSARLHFSATGLQDLRDDGEFRAKVLIGPRLFVGDNGSLNLEYYFNGDGYSSGEFDDFVSGARKLGQILRASSAGLGGLGSLAGVSSSDPGSPQRFSFDPMRRHYALVSYNQTQLADDWTINALLLMGLEDLSGQVAPTVTWSVREWLSLTAAAFVTVPGLASQGGQVAGTSEHYTEFGLTPTSWRAFLSARAFY
jgi:hypothetical protein